MEIFFKLFIMIIVWTSSKTRLMLSVSVAVVKWQNSSRDRLARYTLSSIRTPELLSCRFFDTSRNLSRIKQRAFVYSSPSSSRDGGV